MFDNIRARTSTILSAFCHVFFALKHANSAESITCSLIKTANGDQCQLTLIQETTIIIYYFIRL